MIYLLNKYLLYKCILGNKEILAPHISIKKCKRESQESDLESDNTSLTSKAEAIGANSTCTLLGNAFKETIDNGGTEHLSSQLYFYQLK